MSILTPPLSKRGILKALGQDPSKSDVLTVSTNLSGGVVSVPTYIKPANFSACIVASLSAGATYSQSGMVITVTSTAHGIAPQKNGNKLYWPGDTNYPAQWMGSFNYIDANTFSIAAPESATVAPGRSITAVSSAPMTALVEFASITLYANTLLSNCRLTAHLARSGDVGSAAKRTRVMIGGQQISSAIFDAANSGAAMIRQSVWGISAAKQVAMAYEDGRHDASQNIGTVDMTADQLVSLCVQLSAANQFVSIDGCIIEIA